MQSPPSWNESVPRDVMADVNTMFGEMVAYHPRNSHWYLPTIGIEPHLHRKGSLGTVDASAQPVRPGSHAGLPGIQQLCQRGVIPAVRLRGAGCHTCGPFAAYGPNASRRTLIHFNRSRPMMAPGDCSGS